MNGRMLILLVVSGLLFGCTFGIADNGNNIENTTDVPAEPPPPLPDVINTSLEEEPQVIIVTLNANLTLQAYNVSNSYLCIDRNDQTRRKHVDRVFSGNIIITDEFNNTIRNETRQFENVPLSYERQEIENEIYVDYFCQLEEAELKYILVDEVRICHISGNEFLDRNTTQTIGEVVYVCP